jgi:O-antigen ligase
MIRTLHYPDSPLRRRAALACIAILWMLVCAQWLAHTLAYPTKLGVCLTIACLLLPWAVLNFSRIPIYLLCVYVALVPFNSLLSVETADSGSGATGETLTKLLGIAAAGCLLLATVARRRTVTPSKAMYVLGALTVYLGLTVCWAIDSTVAFDSYRTYLNYVGLYFAIAIYPVTRKEAQLVIAATLAGAVASAAYGAYFYWHGEHLLVSRLNIRIAGERIDPNEYAVTLLTPIAISVMAFLRSRAVHKLLWFSALLVLLAGVAMSGSRGAMIAMVIMFAFLTWRSKYRLQLFAFVPLIAIAVVASPIGHRLLQSDLANADLRVDIWKVGIASLRQYWLSGAGIGNFGNAYAQYFLAVPHETLSWNKVAHSVLLQSAVEYGLPGLLLVLAVWYTQFRVLRAVANNDRMHDIALALQAGVLGLFVSGLSLSLMLYKYTWLTFGLVALVRSAALNLETANEPSLHRASSTLQASTKA